MGGWRNAVQDAAASKPLFLTIYATVIVGILVSSFYVFSAIYSPSASNAHSISTSWVSSPPLSQSRLLFPLFFFIQTSVFSSVFMQMLSICYYKNQITSYSLLGPWQNETFLMGWKNVAQFWISYIFGTLTLCFYVKPFFIVLFFLEIIILNSWIGHIFLWNYVASFAQMPIWLCFTRLSLLPFIG